MSPSFSTTNLIKQLPILQAKLTNLFEVDCICDQSFRFQFILMDSTSSKRLKPGLPGARLKNENAVGFVQSLKIMTAFREIVLPSPWASS
jgi:hypothetical protein